MTKTDGSVDSRQNGQVHGLRHEVERYRQASEDALQQLDWCIGYLHGCGKKGLAGALARNRSHIRRQLLQRPEQPLPTEKSHSAGS